MMMINIITIITKTRNLELGIAIKMVIFQNLICC